MADKPLARVSRADVTALITPDLGFAPLHVAAWNSFMTADIVVIRG